MPKGVMVVQTGPVDAAREDEYHDWYTNTHIPEILAIPGFVSARRFKVRGGAEPSYLAIYELDADDLGAAMKELSRRSAAGETTASDALRMDPPPIITIAEQSA
jgi:hypothetical protein